MFHACPAASERPQLSDIDEEAGSPGDGSPGGSTHGSLRDEPGSWKQQQQPGDVELQPARRQLPAAAAALLRRGPAATPPRSSSCWRGWRTAARAPAGPSQMLP